MRSRSGAWVGAALLLLGGCVMQSTYNSMLAQQQSFESALRSEMSAQQVETELLLRPR